MYFWRIAHTYLGTSLYVNHDHENPGKRGLVPQSLLWNESMVALILEEREQTRIEYASMQSDN